MVRKVVSQTFVAFDNTVHPTLEAAKAHEEVGFLKQFTNLRPEKLDAVWAGETEVAKKLGLAFEALGLKLRARRFERGEKVFRGERKAKTDASVDAPTHVVEADEEVVAAE